MVCVASAHGDIPRVDFSHAAALAGPPLFCLAKKQKQKTLPALTHLSLSHHLAAACLATTPAASLANSYPYSTHLPRATPDT